MTGPPGTLCGLPRCRPTSSRLRRFSVSRKIKIGPGCWPIGMMTAERIGRPSVNRWVRTFRRYVAIGDSSTEGLEDPNGEGGYRGWADRLAQHIADAQDEPLEYANLAIRGYRMREIRTNQFEAALAME